MSFGDAIKDEIEAIRSILDGDAPTERDTPEHRREKPATENGPDQDGSEPTTRAGRAQNS